MAGVGDTLIAEPMGPDEEAIRADDDAADAVRAVPEPPRPRHGFSRWNNPEKHTAAAVKGGRAAHAKGVAHEWTSASARAAALKSVAVRRAKKAEAVRLAREPIPGYPETVPGV